MNLSTLLPIGIAVSLFAGVTAAVAGWGWSKAHPTGRSHGRMAAGCAGGLLVNSWWLAFLGMAFWKIFILRQDP